MLLGNPLDTIARKPSRPSIRNPDRAVSGYTETTMKISSTQFTVSEYCEQFARSVITVNRDYQRSNKVWPAAAKSYLIDTILLDFPIQKILLRQKTILPSRKTQKEVIDGQQRTQAIFDFYSDLFPITLRASAFFGKRFSTLEYEHQQSFLDYPISTDIFSSTTDEEIREIFRRMNSYTVPLNKQELRHATNQGDFKWFVHALTVRYSEQLKILGVITENQISRMGDAELFTDVLAAVENGIETGSPSKLDKLYNERDASFPNQTECQTFIDEAFTALIPFTDLVQTTKLSSRHNFYSLLLALGNTRRPIPKLDSLLNSSKKTALESPLVVRENLSSLISAVEEGEARKSERGARRTQPAGPFADFVSASIAATNTKSNRERRFKWMSQALLAEPLR